MGQTGVGLMVRVAGFRSLGPEFETLSAVELTLSGVDSACHPYEVEEMSTSVLAIEGTASVAQLCPQKMMQPSATGCTR